MKKVGGNLELTATDVSHFLGCRHRSALDASVATGRLEAPTWVDPVLVVLQQRGLEHEERYAESLRATGVTVRDLGRLDLDEAVGETIACMRDGVDVILQPAFREGRWSGRPDVLRRIASPSGLGDWSYEVLDTKLAIETRGGTILQLALYSGLVGRAQEALPERFHVVTPRPDAPMNSYRFNDYAAYFRLVRARLEAFASQDPEDSARQNYPEPVEHCEVCRWRGKCDRKRREDDHLSLVAGLSGLQSRELQLNGIARLEQLATLPLPLPITPRRGALDSYVRAREQARVQLDGRRAGSPVFELLPIIAERGLTRLPAPSVGDLFLDLEGDPFARDGGREYLFGVVGQAPDGSLKSSARWSFTDWQEKAAFEETVDAIIDAWRAHPEMHVYHYAPYEPAAFKRLMGRHASRESEIDQLLRAGVFVDMHAIVRHSVRASVESYSIKDLEVFYGFRRSVSLTDARIHLRLVERALELVATDAIGAESKEIVEGYNRDDCVSVLQLRAWLERLRATIEAGGTEVPRPTVLDGVPPERVNDRARRVQALEEALKAGVATEQADRDEEQQARWLLANLLDWHRRESKAPWWEFFRLRDLSEEELLEERAAFAGLRFAGRVGGTARSPIDRYAYPLQDTDIREGDDLHLPDGNAFGKVDAVDRVARTVDVKKRGAQAEVHPPAVFAHSIVPADVLADSLLRIADDVVVSGVSGGTGYRAARQLLLGRPPRLRVGEFTPQEGEDAVRFATRISTNLDGTVLAIQGPPGTGKTFTGAQMICELVRSGARVGVTAVSHKVIRNLLEAVVTGAAAQGLVVRCAHKVTERGAAQGVIDEVTDNAEVLARLKDRRSQVVGGTTWLWSRPDAQSTVDVIFVDEAGQMSLANVIAASQAAESVVLLGDPQQLEQPQQGTHPEGADVSALQHQLGGSKTISPARGIFLPESWRLAPALCEFTSEVFYEGRLRSRAGLDRQTLAGTPPFEGAGLWVVGVPHEGNQNSSLEEVEVVDQIVEVLLAAGASWIDSGGVRHGMTADDILVVAPYNSHVSLLSERLASRSVRVGTVDRFQGQEAPVVIYSMATSAPEDAPRGMEFLYSLSRLNVATSRARCACILVASPRLFEPECKSPRQMQLANAVCRYVEIARAAEIR